MAKKAQQEVKVETVDVFLSRPQSDVMNARTSIITEIAGQGGGKTNVIGLSVGWFVNNFPEAKGFVAANTYEQLSSSTMSPIFKILEEVYAMTEFDRKENRNGHYVHGQRPPRNAGWVKSKYKFKNYSNILSFKNGATVFLGSLDNYKVHDGKEFAWAHLDETKDTKQEALTDVILARLRQKGLWYHTETKNVIWAPYMTAEIAARQGFVYWCPLFIHTSPSTGTTDWLVPFTGIAPYEQEIKKAITQKGASYFVKEINGNTVVVYDAYHNEQNLPPGYLETREGRMSEAERLRFICGYPFSKNGGEYFPGFDRFKHTGKVKYNNKLPIHMAFDFNSTPYLTLLCSQVEYVWRWWDEKAKIKYYEATEGCKPIEVLQIRFFKEFCQEPAISVEATCEQFIEFFQEDEPEVFVYGDSTGNARIVGLGALTQYKIIGGTLEKELYLGEGWKRVKAANVANIKRRDLLNKIFEGKVPEVEILVDEDECPNLMRDFEYVLMGKEGKHKEKKLDANGIPYESIGHTSDAAEYEICYLCDDILKEF